MIILSAALLSLVSWASTDVHYDRNAAIPTPQVTDTTLTAWRGERISALALVHSDSKGAVTSKLTGPLKGTANLVSYVLTDEFRACGVHPTDLQPYEVPDIIDSPSILMEAGETRPVWVSIDVPRDAKPGVYTDTLTVDGEKLLLRVKVQDKVLPEQYSFYLNLWQQPYSVCRYGKVEPWSKEHFKLLEPYADMLARAGQKTISAILFFEPWGEQSNDLFLPMVETTKKKDGTWKYDYTVFDKWVEFMDKHGVGPDIECFSMVPWEMKFRYFDEKKGDYEFLQTKTDTPEYKELWGNFLKSFQRHLDKKGWTDRTFIAMDERAMPDMLNAMAIIDEYSPKLKVTLAGNYHKELSDKVSRYTLTVGDSFPPGEVKRRRDNGQISNLYTCCSTQEPNLFSNSMPADAAWLPVHVTATGHDGYLHWSWMNWTDDPMHDSRFKLFAPGDTYFIYPDGKSSVRFERLIEGIQLSEKIKEIKANGSKEDILLLEEAMVPFMDPEPSRHNPTWAQVKYLKKTIDKLSAQ